MLAISSFALRAKGAAPSYVAYPSLAPLKEVTALTSR
jgi:hypothetical protein